MATEDHIRNPLEWGWDQIKLAGTAISSTGHAVAGPGEGVDTTPPVVRRIEIADLKEVLAKGFADFGAYRTDVFFVCLIYPVAGLFLINLAFGYDMLPLLFPLASGFTLIGPIAAVGLYEMSRRREKGFEVTWSDAFAVTGSPAFGAIMVLGLVLLTIFVVWMAVAQIIYDMTLGPKPPVSIEAFVNDVVTTSAGWAMVIVGMGTGFLFAVLVLAISVVSFPLLLDRNVGVYTAVETSIRAVMKNPEPMAVWGLIVAGGLVIGMLPVFIGLVIILPVLGHATWHLYRKVVAS
ncbi:MAG: DUF2189 domain-containing protein [Alphaproteobacteria bacterium]|nr:DUF2189 domain-containing protein [Alphaproteobacteria bacterium]